MRLTAFTVFLLTAKAFLIETNRDQIPIYEIDFDQPASIRYNHVFNDFIEPLLDMENYWYSTIPAESKAIIENNLAEYAAAHPDNFATMQSLATILGLPVQQTVMVNLITELHTFCTSIVTRNTKNEVAHVRNLDFGDTANMQRLVIEASFIKGGVERARITQIVGFLGTYTGRSNGFSVSYNVRQSTFISINEQLNANLRRNLDPFYTPAQDLLQLMLLDVEDFAEAVERASSSPLTSPCYMIIGGISNNEGVVLTRDHNKLAHAAWLGDESWFQIATNRDVYNYPDKRYLIAYDLMEELGPERVEVDGQTIIQHVLWQPGVLEDITIFTASISVQAKEMYTAFPP